MKKIIITGLPLLASFTLSHADGMSTISTLYMSLEGSYTGNQFNGLTLNNNLSNLSSEPFGGRLAAGVVRSYSERLRFSGEFGGGYYGGTKVTIPKSDWVNQHTIDGYDLLMGALYKVNQFDVFGQVGAMTQNNRSNRTQNYAVEIPGGLYSGIAKSKYSTTQVLPEIKVGCIYNLNANWGISLAYMHAFGSSMQGDLSVYASTTSIAINGDKDIQNPSLNSAMLGIRYNIG